MYKLTVWYVKGGCDNTVITICDSKLATKLFNRLRNSAIKKGVFTIEADGQRQFIATDKILSASLEEVKE